MTHIVILGGGPGGYEAALVAAQLGAQVTLVDSDGIGGSCVLTDCVPSKTLIATSDVMTSFAGAAALGVQHPPDVVDVDPAAVMGRVLSLAAAQSADIAASLARAGVEVVRGTGRLAGPHRVAVSGHKAVTDRGTGPGTNQDPASDPTTVRERVIDADVVLLSVGASPRELPGSPTDGDRILTWRQLWALPALPEHLVIVGSGVTGAEFAAAFRAMGSEVSLVSSRDRVLPGEDPDAAAVIESVFTRRGIDVVGRARAAAVTRHGDEVRVTCTDGRVITGSHALIAVGSVPRTAELGLAEAGVALDAGGFIKVDKVSRTSVPEVYAAGDCTGVLMLASVAAMQGRIAMYHALGEAVVPLRLAVVAANVFTDPEIATVGVSERQVADGAVAARIVKLPLVTNARAKMQGITDGFVKLFCRPGSGSVLGGVVVAPHASELILPVSLAVQHGLTVNQIAATFSIYPSLSGSTTEAARQLMAQEEAQG